MAGPELPERELELIAMIAREIAAMDHLVHDMYSLTTRVGNQLRRLDDLEKLLQQHTTRKEKHP